MSLRVKVEYQSGEIAQLVRVLPHNHKDLSFEPPCSYENPDAVTYIMHWGGGGRRGLEGSLGSQLEGCTPLWVKEKLGADVSSRCRIVSISRHQTI